MPSDKGLTREFLQERDLRIFKMRQAGVPVSEIARRFGISTNAAHSALKRQLEKLNREALMAYPEVLRMELERLDALQQSIWPLTQFRKVTMDDGVEVQVEPDLKAIQQVLAIMDRRSKLLGMEQTNINLSIEEQSPQRAALAGEIEAIAVDAFSPETEAKKLLELMGTSGVLPDSVVKQLLMQHETPLAISASSETSTIIDVDPENEEEVYGGN
jgi:transposase-like protein